MLGVGSRGPLAGREGPVEADGRGLTERQALAVLVAVEGLGPATLGRLVAGLGSAAKVLAAASAGDREALAQAARLEGRAAPDGVLTAVIDAARVAPETWRRIEQSAVDVVTLDDHDYPPRLRAIELPPHALFVRGSRAALSAARAVAIVGTRRPTESGRLTAARIAAAVTRAGAAVVSGLAVGIDGAAHAGCLEEDGTTVAVLGGGHDRLYPRSHRKLVDRILDSGGAVVSEFAPDVEPTQGTFPRRNRIISGLSEATIVVEAGARSGALVTASWCLEQGRECFVVPGPIDRPTSTGCLALLRESHDLARIVAGVPQLLEDLNLVGDPASGEQPLARPAAAALVELGTVARRVARLLVAGHSTADELVAATGLPIAAVLTALTILEDRRLVVQAYGIYRPVGALAASLTPPSRAAS